MVQQPGQLGIAGLDLNPLDDIADALVDRVGDALGGLINAATSDINQVVDKITSAIDTSVEFVRELPNTVTENVERLVDGTVNTVGATVRGLTAAAQAGLDNTLGFAEDAISSAFNAGEQVIGNIAAEVGETFEGLTSGITSGISSLIDNAAELTGEIVTKLQSGLTSIADTFRSAAATVGEELSGGFISLAGALDNITDNWLQNLMGPVSGDLVAELQTVFDSIPEVRRLEAGNNPVVALAGLVGSGAISISVGFALPLVIANFLSVLMTPISQLALQREHEFIQWRYLPTAEQVDANRRGLIPNERFFEVMRREGFRDQEARLAWDMKFIEPPTDITTQLWLREFIDEDKHTEDLQKLGWRRSDIENLKRLAFQLPPVQDLITMAVREVFTPEVAERFGQFEDIPQEFLDVAKQSGLSTEWATNYWAAHWGLPSAQMGFQMLHRGIIEEDDLRLLLRSLDVMPFWRDKMIALSFLPLTRVDVRRMHRTGVLTDQDVHRAYLDLGYSELNATRLTEFTVALTNAANERETEAEIDLTKSDIQGLFRDGIITRAEAQEFFSELGIAEDETEFLLDRIELALDIEQRKSEIQLVLARAQSGEFDQTTAVSQLNELDLTDSELNTAVGKLVLILDKRTKLPTKKEVLTWFKDGVLDRSEAESTLGLMGYRPRWVDLYIDTADSESASDEPSAEAFTGEI